MAITVSNNAYITVDGVDLTDHCNQITLNDGQESREITHLQSSTKVYRAAQGTATIEATFLNDHSTGSVENMLRSCLLMQNNPQTKTPTSAMIAYISTSGPGNLAAGLWRYWVTFGFRSFESGPSTYSQIMVVSTSANNIVLLDPIPVSSDWYCTERNIYRTQTAGGDDTTAVLLTTLSDNTTTTYVDNTSSSSLIGAEAMSQTWTPTGFPVVVRKYATAQGINNPNYTLTALVDGDINVLDSKVGEIDQVKVSFKPFGALAVSTTS